MDPATVGHHEPAADVLPGKQREGADLGDRLSSAVGVQGAHARDAAVQRDQQVQALGLSHLADDDPRGPHPQRLLDQPAQRDLARALQAGLAALHRGDVSQRDLQLEDFLAGDHPLPRRDSSRKAVQHRRLPGLGAARDKDVQPRRHGGVEEPCRRPRQRAQADEVVEVVGLDDELADVDAPVGPGDVRDDDVEAGAVGRGWRRRRATTGRPGGRRTSASARPGRAPRHQSGACW